jgi:S-adenosylmethionine:tRNA ribosyltransferase-isomerase
VNAAPSSTLASHATKGRLSFDLPAHLEAAEPPEARGLTRDAVRMLVAERGSERLTHTTFGSLPTFLRAGDLVVINTSAVVPAAVTAWGDDGTKFVVHLSTQLDDGRWVVEPRQIDGRTTRRWDGPVPLRMRVGTEATIALDAPYLASSRLWVAQLHLPQPVFTWLAVHGQPIRYSYVDRPWPIAAYQNVYATEPGSAEMPSAGRPFTPEVITRLVAKGVGVSPLVLHTGVASLEAAELPYPERLRVPATTANRVNQTRSEGGRVIAVGTTVVRALETAGGEDAVVQPVDGWTDLVITPERGVHVVDGLLTGWHEPEASHLMMLEAVAGRALLEASYTASLQEGYLWHEFGDMHLILP